MQQPAHDRDLDLRFAFLIEPPFCYRAADGGVTGCDVEVARRALDRIGVRSLRLIETEFSELLPGLRDGRWHMTTGLFISDERRKWAVFSRPIWALPDGLLVRAENPSAIEGYRSLARMRASQLGVVAGQVQHQTAQRLGVADASIRCFRTYARAADAILAGEIDAFASVMTAHRGYLGANRGLPLTAIEVPFSEKKPEAGAFAFANSQAKLRDAVDEALSDFLGSAGHTALLRDFGLASTWAAEIG